MINTVSIKSAQLTEGFFTIGSGKEVVLIMGSCRVAPYVEYLHQWNEANGNRFTIHSLDPFNFNWNIQDERCDYEEALSKWETDGRMLSMLSSVDIFIHEFYKNSGMFNVDKVEKSIYDFGMKAKIDCCIPNLNDYFILFKDIVSFDLELRKKAIQDINVIGRLSEEIQKEIYVLSQRNLNKFYEVCLKSDVPEMKYYVENNFRKDRLWHSYNHVSKYFTLALFNLVNDKYLKLAVTSDFLTQIFREDMFANSFTPLTEYDLKWYGYLWDEEIKSIL